MFRFLNIKIKDKILSEIKIIDNCLYFLVYTLIKIHNIIYLLHICLQFANINTHINRLFYQCS